MNESILILAIGGNGGNIVELLRKEAKHIEPSAVHYVFADCNKMGDLWRREVPDCDKIALDVRHQDYFPEEVFNGIDKLVVVAGLGGMTGSKFTELAVRAALKLGVSQINVVITFPFSFEGTRRFEKAISAASSLKEIEGINLTSSNVKSNANTLSDTFDLGAKHVMKIVESLI